MYICLLTLYHALYHIKKQISTRKYKNIFTNKIFCIIIYSEVIYLNKKDSLYVSEEQMDIQREYMSRVRLINESNEHANRPKCYTHTYGCQQNENDTEYINGMLLQMGYTFTDDRKDADLILFNTCAVREHAEQKVFGNIGALLNLKRNKPDLIICLCGCMMGQEHIKKEIESKYKYVNLIFGTQALYKFPENLYKVISTGTRIFDIKSNDVIVEGIPIKRENDLKAWVSVMSGCNNFCSYCIVPYVRGRERSRNPVDIINEVKSLVLDGYREITLLGQNVNSYYKDCFGEYDFADLLMELNDLDGNFILKFMTSHPKDASKKLIDTIAKGNKICKHLHLPFQSGSNDILHKMNRQYTREMYMDLIDYARQCVPDIAISSDVIVGFPGETEEDFAQTLALVEEVRFNGLYTFIYSARKGTPAAEMNCQISKDVKMERFHRLVTLQTQICTEINTAYIGRTVKAFVDGYSEKQPGVMTGRTMNNTIVHFEVDKPVILGQTVYVRIEKALNWAIFGKIVEEEK